MNLSLLHESLQLEFIYDHLVKIFHRSFDVHDTYQGIESEIFFNNICYYRSYLYYAKQRQLLRGLVVRCQYSLIVAVCFSE